MILSMINDTHHTSLLRFHAYFFAQQLLPLHGIDYNYKKAALEYLESIIDDSHLQRQQQQNDSVVNGNLDGGGDSDSEPEDAHVQRNIGNSL